MKAVILAAGRGTRLRPITDSIAKAMVSVNGETLIERILLQIREAGITDVLIVVGYKKETIITKIGNGEKFQLDISYIEQQELLGTGHALMLSRKFVKNDDLFLIFADTYFKDNYIKEILHDDNKCVAGVVSVEPKMASNYGVIEFNDMKTVNKIIEKPSLPPSNKAIIGIYKLQNCIFNYLDNNHITKRGEIELPDAINRMIASGVIFSTYEMNCVIDIASVADLKKANEIAAYT